MQDQLLDGRYQILARLGVGGMAEVFRAKDHNLQREVAIKILRKDFVEDPEFRARFLQEARSAANLIHPNIVTIHDFGTDGDRTYIVMEYVHGTDLKTLVRRQGMLPVDQAVDLMIQACAGVGYAHRAGLVHCDVKPHNILISTDNRAKVTDFGIARALAMIEPEETTEVVWGSPQYFAPEQAAGKPPSPASDVYSLGVILFELITGRLPFEATESSLLADMHLATPPPSPRRFNPTIPIPLEEIILKVLSKEPASRYRTADQFGRVLERFVNTTPTGSGLQTLEEAAFPLHPHEDQTTYLETVESRDIDWLAILLGIAAFVAVGGLIPLWLWIWLLYRGPS